MVAANTEDGIRAMELANLKRSIQDHFRDRLVTVVGSGLSAGEGLPTMGQLECHLGAEVPMHLPAGSAGEWDRVKAELSAGAGLEAALHRVQVSQELGAVILSLTSTYILDSEREVIRRAVAGERKLRFAKLLPFLNPQPNDAVPVVTVNYDRLIEIGAEISGWGVDTMFVGTRLGVLDPGLSARSFVRDVVRRSKGAYRLTYRNRIAIYKPHGSLDWFRTAKGPVYCPIEVPGERLIVTPGVSKYRQGYERPFDVHREKANAQIDTCRRLFCVGYGFNDDHLQVHLSEKMRAGTPTLILARSLSSSAMKLIAQSPGAIAVASNPKDSSGSTIVVVTANTSQVVVSPPLWDLAVLIEEVLSP